MRRYYAGSRPLTNQKEACSWLDDFPMLPQLAVHELDHSPRDTGLVDASGISIFALSERLPIGFTHHYPD